MILSDRYRYVFVELPHTASTAIARELRERYAGEPILEKHAPYHRFLAIATPEQRRYFVFSGIRNPLDEVVTCYFRYKTDHRRYSDRTKWRRNGGSISDDSVRRYLFVQQNEADFAAYLRRFHRWPYDTWAALDHRSFDHVIRFERLQEGFAEVLALLGIERTRPLPSANRTAERSRSFTEYYPPALRPYAARIFGPYMEKWGYEFPREWGEVRVPRRSRLLFRVLGPLRRARWRAS